MIRTVFQPVQLLESRQRARQAQRACSFSSLPPLPPHLQEDVFEHDGVRARVIQVNAWPVARTIAAHLCTPAAAPVTASVLSSLGLWSYDAFPVLTPVEVAQNSDEWDEYAVYQSREFLTRRSVRELRASGYRVPTSLDRDVQLFGTPLREEAIHAQLARLRPRTRDILQRAFTCCSALSHLKVTTERENAAVQDYLDRAHPDPLYAGSIALEPYLAWVVEHTHDLVQQGGDERYPVSIWATDDPAYRAYRVMLPRKVHLVRQVLDLLSA